MIEPIKFLEKEEKIKPIKFLAEGERLNQYRGLQCKKRMMEK